MHSWTRAYKLPAEKLNVTFVDTRHWNIDLTFDGVHFTEAGHHTFAEKPGKELCLMESSHTPIALGKHSFPTLVMSNSGPFQYSSKDEYRIKYRFPILLASVFFCDCSNYCCFITFRFAQFIVSSVSLSCSAAICKKQLHDYIENTILIIWLNPDASVSTVISPFRQGQPQESLRLPVSILLIDI